ncbi:MAG: 50S ribosomal protein L15 [Alphaproteobacteria bacterium]|nr:50S ribosomal protein L15 [Alphaproteobacteria bacterium]
MRLNEIRDNKGARKKRMRVARGIGSGKKKTGGRGQKGQLSRSGVHMNGFEGGQIPIFRRLPKRGFFNHAGLDFSELTLKDLQRAIDSKQIDAKKPLDEKSLRTARVIRQRKDGIRLIGKDGLKAKVTITVAGASAGAAAAVAAAGGTLTIEAPRKVQAALAEAAEPKGKRGLRRKAATAKNEARFAS